MSELSRLARRLWSDDQGAVISVELILAVGILVFGLIPGLIAVRNSVTATMGTLGNVIVQIVPSFTFSGFAIANNATTPVSTIAAVQGLQVNYATPGQLQGVQTAPNTQNISVVSPAP